MSHWSFACFQIKDVSFRMIWKAMHFGERFGQNHFNQSPLCQSEWFFCVKNHRECVRWVSSWNRKKVFCSGVVLPSGSDGGWLRQVPVAGHSLMILPLITSKRPMGTTGGKDSSGWVESRLCDSRQWFMGPANFSAILCTGNGLQCGKPSKMWTTTCCPQKSSNMTQSSVRQNILISYLWCCLSTPIFCYGGPHCGLFEVKSVQLLCQHNKKTNCWMEAFTLGKQIEQIWCWKQPRNEQMMSHFKFHEASQNPTWVCFLQWC